MLIQSPKNLLPDGQLEARVNRLAGDVHIKVPDHTIFVRDDTITIDYSIEIRCDIFG